MVFPTSNHKVSHLPAELAVQTINESDHMEQMIQIIGRAYEGSIDNEIFGIRDHSKLEEEVAYLFRAYSFQNLSFCIQNQATGEVVGLCIAGIGENTPLGFAEIAELCVAPAYKNKGIAKLMLQHIKAAAHAHTPVVKLCVTIGNHAEGLYRKMGFQAGDRFARMTKR